MTIRCKLRLIHIRFATQIATEGIAVEVLWFLWIFECETRLEAYEHLKIHKSAKGAPKSELKNRKKTIAPSKNMCLQTQMDAVLPPKAKSPP